MPDLLNVLFLSSEVYPFAKTGGLADVSAALPAELNGPECNVKVMMPRYGSIREKLPYLRDVPGTSNVQISTNRHTYVVHLQTTPLRTNGPQVPVYFLACNELFNRPGIYVHPETQKDFPDNDERFIVFCRGALESVKAMGWRPDIIHCNDWPTGLVPAYLKSLYRSDPFFRSTRTVFTIHNMAYQGIFPTDTFVKTGLPQELLGVEGVEAYGRVNFLKAGLVFSDVITTVSARYAAEIQSSSEFGAGLEGVVQKRSADVHGILNGADYSIWDPGVDMHIPHQYDASTLHLKKENTRALLEKVGLPFDDQRPVIGMISRLADQKGFDLLAQIIDQLGHMNLQLVVLGTGEQRFRDLLLQASKKYPNTFRIQLSFDDPLAHLIEAGSNMFLMPSKYEPCGLNQMYSLRYGTVPIVRATGGLDDTIVEVNPTTGTGTGFKFKRYSATELLVVIQRAVRLFGNREIWEKIMRNGMQQDFSWSASARKYLELYQSLVSQ